jgi:hypothetical protein
VALMCVLKDAHHKSTAVSINRPAILSYSRLNTGQHYVSAKDSFDSKTSALSHNPGHRNLHSSAVAN